MSKKDTKGKTHLVCHARAKDLYRLCRAVIGVRRDAAEALENGHAATDAAKDSVLACDISISTMVTHRLGDEVIEAV